VRKLDNKKCIIFIRGFDPIMDSKFIPFGHPAFDQTADGKGKPYVHVPNSGGGGQALPFQLLTPKALSYYEELKKKGENVYIDKIDYKDFELLTDAGMQKRFISMEEQEQKEQLNREQDNELMYAQEDVPEPEAAETKPKQAEKEPVPEPEAAGRRIEGEDTIMNRMAQWKYSKEQKDELHKMIALGMPTKTILAVFYPETDVIKMREIRKTFQTVRHSEN
jgi:type IV secretion system protein VirD4